ncbi:hypothetical protein [Leeia oryzae]|uniref:hypothetical protein n=1 Tax=Leeia oryzae TaxID=356662 RepID=UPI00035D8B4B|nr:hypothetical protein [Leeia oryzae]
MIDSITFLIQAILIAYRTRLLALTGMLVFFVLSAMGLAHSFSPRQADVVALDVALSCLRIGGLLLLLILAQQLIVVDIERRVILGVIALPVKRHSYLVGRFLAISSLLLVFVVASGLGVFLEAHYMMPVFAGLSQPEWLKIPAVLGGVWIELVVILSAMIFFTTLAKTPYLSAILTLGFAVASRSLHAALNYLMHDPDASAKVKVRLLPALDFIRWLVPDLSLLDWRDAALYAQPWEKMAIFPSILMATGYSALLIIGAVWLFQRREFD